MKLTVVIAVLVILVLFIAYKQGVMTSEKKNVEALAVEPKYSILNESAVYYEGFKG